MAWSLPAKDPDAVEPYHIIWCSADGTNDGTANDTGELQGATIASSAWSVLPASQLTIDSDNNDAATIQGISYAVNTISTVVLSAGTANSDYVLTNEITTNDGRTLNKSITIRVREQ